jgi:hypothetical protein
MVKMKTLLSIFIISLMPVTLSAQALAPSEAARQKIVEKMDKNGLRFRTQAVTEQSDKLIQIPDFIQNRSGFEVAKTPPSIDFLIVPLEERFLTPVPDETFVGVWSNWSQGTYDAKEGKFYAAVGNHRYHKARLYLIEYDTRTKTVRTMPEINKVLGRTDAQFGDGKIHGWLDFYNGPELFFCTYWCKYPQPTEAQFQSGYDGGAIMSYNVENGNYRSYGIPLPRSSWPYHRMDTKRGLMFAVGMFGEFMCYDIANQRIRFAGYLPEGMRWFWRTMLVDEETGYVYSTNNLPSDTTIQFIRYEPVKNRFFKMKSSVPANRKTGKFGQMRAHSKYKTKDGAFIGVIAADTAGSGGELFKFYPLEDRVQDLGLCWEGDQRYTASLAMSPDQKYLYYIPAAHGKTYLEGAPLVQYNLATQKRKVIAFLFPYFYEKYGYIPGGTYSINLDEKGKSLFVLLNGAFSEYNPQGRDTFGDPSVMVIHIPASERQ